MVGDNLSTNKLIAHLGKQKSNQKKIRPPDGTLPAFS